MGNESDEFIKEHKKLFLGEKAKLEAAILQTINQFERQFGVHLVNTRSTGIDITCVEDPCVTSYTNSFRIDFAY